MGDVSFDLGRVVSDGLVASLVAGGRRGFGRAIFGAAGIRELSRGGGCGLCSLGSGETDRCGEYPAGGKTGCIVDVRPEGELGRIW